MSLQRHLSGDGIAHANADSKTHAKHVRQRATMRKVDWVPEPMQENQAIEFRFKGEGLALGKGAYFKDSGDDEKAVAGLEFENHCSAVNWQRRWNIATMTRGTKKATVRRKRSSPACEEFVLNLSPFQMRFINGELDRWEKGGISAEKRREMLEAMLNEIRRDVVEEFKLACGRDIVASYIHFDSNKIHFGIVHSRVGPENQLVGMKRLGTLGPWSVGQNRLAKLGLVDVGDLRLRENMERFEERFGKDRPPLDIRLHDLVDVKFSDKVEAMGGGALSRFAEAKDYYKKWKVKNRRDAFSRTPSAQRIAWETVRLVQPLLPPQLRAAISVAQTAVQVFQILGVALDAISSQPLPSQNKQREINKIL